MKQIRSIFEKVRLDRPGNWHKKTFERYFEEQNRAEWLSRLTIGIIRDIILDTTAYCFGCAMTYWRGLNKED